MAGLGVASQICWALPAAAYDDEDAPPRAWQDKPATAPVVPKPVLRESIPEHTAQDPAAEANPSSASTQNPAPSGIMGGNVQRGDLAPVLAPGGSGLPYDVWHGYSVPELGEQLASLDIPPRSPAMFSLWRRLITTDEQPGTPGNAAFEALRVEALGRSGLLAVAANFLRRSAGETGDPYLNFLLAKTEIGLGNKDAACAASKGPVPLKALSNKVQQVEAALVEGYCAAVSGDQTRAALAAGIARDLGVEGLAGPDLLDAAAGGIKPSIPKGARVTPLDFRIAALAGGLPADDVLAAATPGLLAVLARATEGVPADLRIAAGERAAALSLIDPEDVAALYRAPAEAGDAALIERATLYKQAEAERTPVKKARLIRAFLDEAHRAGFYWTALTLMAKPANLIEPVAEIGWFAETAVEANLAAADFSNARRWARFGSSLPQQAGSLDHWLALIDITDTAPEGDRTQNLAALERLAQGGRLDANLLHRIATTLDALDIQVPIPLWDLASRAPQPAGGHLPDTGVLSALADASKKKEFGRTVLLSIKALGSDGPDRAHIIALGDSIRALKRAGLDADARRLGLEGVFLAWPRTVAN